MDLSNFLADSLGLTKIPKYLPTIIWSCIAYTFFHLIIAPWLCRRWFSEAYTSKSRAAKNNWEIRMTAQLHVLIIVPLAFYSAWSEDSSSFDPVFGWSDTKGYVHALAAGHFLWHLFDTIINFDGMTMVMHGIVCFLVYALSFKPFAAYYSTRCLLWETSTWFLNIHWYLGKTNRIGTSFALINRILLFSTFFGIRIIYGTLVCGHFLITLSNIWRDIPFFYIIVYAGGILVMQGLNTIWFIRMIVALRKRFDTKQDERIKLLVDSRAATAASGYDM